MFFFFFIVLFSVDLCCWENKTTFCVSGSFVSGERGFFSLQKWRQCSRSLPSSSRLGEDGARQRGPFRCLCARSFPSTLSSNHMKSFCTHRKLNLSHENISCRMQMLRCSSRPPPLPLPRRLLRLIPRRPLSSRSPFTMLSRSRMSWPNNFKLSFTHCRCRTKGSPLCEITFCKCSLRGYSRNILQRSPQSAAG